MCSTSWTCGRYHRYPANFYACTSSLGNAYVENKNPHSKVRPKTNVSVHRKTRSSLWCRNHGVVGKMIGTRKLVIRFSIFDAMRTSAVATCAWWHTYAHTHSHHLTEIFSLQIAHYVLLAVSKWASRTVFTACKTPWEQQSAWKSSLVCVCVCQIFLSRERNPVYRCMVRTCHECRCEPARNMKHLHERVACTILICMYSLCNPKKQTRPHRSKIFNSYSYLSIYTCIYIYIYNWEIHCR